MEPTQLTALLDRLIANWEDEVVEFKEANDNYSTGEIGKYFSALANEANLRSAEAAWLVFGVKDKGRTIVGTEYRPEPDRLQSLKQQLLQDTEPRATVREIHELQHPSGRVLLFQIPAAPRGIPILWKGVAYGRAGESLTPLPFDRLDEIRGQGASTDWSAAPVPSATTADLDAEALDAARAAFTQRHSSSRLSAAEINSWGTETFLDRAGLTSGGHLTRAAILLLAKPESAHLLSPLLAEITWRLMGEERAYEHFGLPFLLNTTRAYERIRNYQVRLLPPGTLIQTEIPKYDRAAVLEAIHNCVAHADYATGGRIVLEEHSDRIVLTNQGDFFDREPDDYVLGEPTPTRYRNPVLVNAMVKLNMIDRIGYGIQLINRAQARRYLPLPDYDLSTPGQVRLTIHGAVINENYTERLMANTELPLGDVLALDRVQKGQRIPKEAAQRLRRARLIEGRSPNLHVSGVVAAAADAKAAYIRTRAQDDAYYAKLVTDYLAKFKRANRQEINDLLWDKLSDALSDTQKRSKVSNLLTKMRKSGQITNRGTQQQPRWELV